MDVAESIKEARRLLAEGNEKEAGRVLTDAAYATHDSELEEQIHQLALEGREAAGLFGKGRWDEIVRISELRGAEKTRGDT
ncbi:MAG: hypothetical protein M3265_04035 [Actinomycetota bacterium]|nr:hypothetical protein [Actinomycetota bacterium]